MSSSLEKGEHASSGSSVRAPSSDGAVMAKDEASPAESIVVDWDGPDDPQNPLNWSPAKRWTQVLIIAVLTFTSLLGSSMFAPGIGLMDEEFHNASDILSTLSLSVFLLGFVFGPFVAAPLAETVGRLPIYHVGNVFFIIFTIACAVSSNINMFIGFRFLQGTFGCIPPTLGGGSVADVMPPLQRGKAINIWALGPVLGPVIGCAGAGYLSMNVSWRWNFYVIAIWQGAITVLALVFLKETYAPALLARKTNRLRKETGNPNLRSKLESDVAVATRFQQAFVRPFKMLCTPIVLILCLDVAIVYSYMYLLFSTFTQAFTDRYGFNTGEGGLVYLSLGIGQILGVGVMTIYGDKYVAKKSAKGEMKPEYRLPPLIPGAFMVPVGLFWYGWAIQAHTYWLVPLLGTVLVGAGVIMTFTPVQTYFVDSYTRYAASAMAANTVLRSLFGAFLPLAGTPMYDRLDYGWGNSVLAFIALAFSPAPFLIMKYGERIRKSKRFAVKF